jgi:hypothetical protein
MSLTIHLSCQNFVMIGGLTCLSIPFGMSVYICLCVSHHLFTYALTIQFSVPTELLKFQKVLYSVSIYVAHLK